MTSQTAEAAVIDMEPELHEHAQAHEQRPSPEYLDFLRRKVEAARADIAAGRWYTSEEVEAYFAARRAGMPRKDIW